MNVSQGYLDMCAHKLGQRFRRQDHLMASGSCGHGNLFPKDTSLIQVSRKFLFHANRTAATPDVSCETQQFLNRNHFHILVTCNLCGLFKVQLAANRNTENVDARPFAPGYQCLEYLLRRHTDGSGRMVSIQILFIKFVEAFPAGDAGLLYSPYGVGLCCHMITCFIIRHLFNICKSELFAIFRTP